MYRLPHNHQPHSKKYNLKNKLPSLYSYITREYRLMIIVGFLLVLVFLSFIIHLDINIEDSLQSPSIAHPLGTTILGKDILSQLIIAVRYSVLLSIITTLNTAILGTMIGLIILNRKYMNAVVQIISNILIAFPPFVICLLLISRWGGATNILILGQFLAFLPIFIRLSYKELSTIMQEEHALTAMGLGNSYLKVSCTHGLSLFVPKIQAQILSLFSVSIGIESGFSYLGIGPPLPHTSLGTILYDSFSYWHLIPWYPISVLLCFILLISSISWVLYTDR